ncbi:MAG: S41 family peptidase [Candidatus Doudnabacteria bacterium]|nr:S41 family peptidase [Candidatus Doudnabacteria bacterium]
MENEQQTDTNIEQGTQTIAEPAIQSPRPGISRKQWTLIVVVFLVAIAASFRSGLLMGNNGFNFDAKQFKIVNQKDQPTVVDYGLLWEAIEVVADKYIEKPVDQQKVLYGAIRGAVSAIGDEYTEFFDPEAFASFKTDLKGTFDGIGAEIGKRDDLIVIIAPLENSPAERAGLRPKDAIVSVDSKLTVNLSVDEVVQLIRGEKGTDVVLTIYREGQADTFDVTIKRETIEIKSVTLEYKQQGDKKIAVIKLSRFGEDTKTLFRKAVDDVKQSGAQGLILDLRNDPGGYLEVSVDVASYWLPKDKLVVTEEHSQEPSITYDSYGYNTLSGLKTVVLINGGSASASEILAGALQDYDIATLIGEKSFGKGSVQELVELEGGGAVKVTVARWITPSGKNLNKDGLNPDIEVVLSDEDFNNDRDPQLDKALEEVVK